MRLTVRSLQGRKIAPPEVKPAMLLHQRARGALRRRQFRRAQSACLESLRLLRRGRSTPQLVAAVYQTLGEIHEVRGEYARAQHYYDQALHAIRSAPPASLVDPEDYVSAVLRLAHILHLRA